MTTEIYNWSAWVNWFYGTENADATITEEDFFTKSQLILDDGWSLIESTSDQDTARQYELEVNKRRLELTEIISLQKQNTSHIDWTQVFEDFLQSQSDQDWEERKLTAPMRFSVLSTIAKEESETWLDTIHSVIVRYKTPEEVCQKWKEFESSWPATQFSKGKLGMLKDFTSLAYAETLTSWCLVRILQAMVKFLKCILYDEFEISASSADSEYVEIRMSVSIIKLVQMHLEVAKKSAATKLDWLPEKWEREERIQNDLLKEREIAAKYIPQQRVSILPSERLADLCAAQQKISHLFETTTSYRHLQSRVTEEDRLPKAAWANAMIALNAMILARGQC